ncbi:MAG TPA: DUF167 domain-containing protein [Candidatus Tumulicola sp.]|nr:DUF167 domain-containing protein [Candidatus Tumulicola sp.]
MLLEVIVKPSSRESGIALDGGTIVARVRERAVDGAANAACVRLLAGCLAVAPSSVVLVRGARARRKLFAVAGLTAAEARRRIEARFSGVNATSLP